MRAGGEVWGVIGGGFGLYGYLPALVKAGARNVIMLERHKPALRGRPELAEFIPSVSWVGTASEMTLACDALVIALPPREQQNILRNLASEKMLRCVVLEKPLAPTPIEASEVLSLAKERATSVRVGYTFLYTDWAALLAAEFSSEEKRHYTIEWRFMAHHYAHNVTTWKSQDESGGGVLRFYAIQLLAFMQSVNATFEGVSHVGRNSRGEAARWTAQFASFGGSTISIEVDSSDRQEIFRVSRGLKAPDKLLELRTPFAGLIQVGGGDARVDVLRRLLATFDHGNAVSHDFYAKVNALWGSVEGATRFTPGLSV